MLASSTLTNNLLKIACEANQRVQPLVYYFYSGEMDLSIYSKSAVYMDAK